MSQAKKLAHSQLRRLAKDPKGVQWRVWLLYRIKTRRPASLKAARAQHVAELRAESEEESAERWVYKSTIESLQIDEPSWDYFCRPAPTKSNAGPKPRPGKASFTVEQKRKLRKWFNKLDW